MTQGWLKGSVPSGNIAPADPQFTRKTEGDIPISEAEHIIRQNYERMGKIGGPIANTFRNLSQIYLNPLIPGERLDIDSVEEASAKRNAELEKAKLWRKKRDDTKNQIIGVLHKARDAYDQTGNEDALRLGLETRDQILEANGMTMWDMNPQLTPESYILRDDAGLWTSSPNPYPYAEMGMEALGGLYGMNKGYAFGEYLLAKKYLKAGSLGALKGFQKAKGPWMFKAAGAVIGGALAVGAADYGYETTLDLMNQAGIAKGVLDDAENNKLSSKLLTIVPDALTFGPRGINRPDFDEKWESLKKDVLIDGAISSTFFGARPIYYGLKSGIGRGIFGMGKKGPGAGAIQMDPYYDSVTGKWMEGLINEEMKLVQKFGGDDLLKEVSEKQTLNVPFVGGTLTDLLRSKYANLLGPAIDTPAFIQGTKLGRHHISNAGFVGGVEPMLGRIPWIGRYIKEHLGDRGEFYGTLSDNMLGRLNPYTSLGEMKEAYKILGQKRFDLFRKEAKRLESDVLVAGDTYGDLVNNQATRIVAREILGAMKSTWARGEAGKIIPTGVNKKWIKLLERIYADDTGKSVRKMFGMRKELDEFIGSKGLGSVARDPESLKDVLKAVDYGTKGSKDDVVDLIKAWDTDIGRLGSAYDAPEVVKALTAYDRFIANGLLMYGTDAGSVAGKVGKYNWELMIDHDSTRAAHSLFKTAMKNEDPSALLALKNIVGDEAYYRGVGTQLRDIFEKNIKEVEGIMKPNYQGIRDALGISRRAKELRIKPFWEKALDTSGTPITKIDGKDFDEALFRSGFPEGTMKSTELTRLPKLDEFRQLLDVMERVFKNGIPSMSVFMARRATIGGVRAGLNAALPTQILGSGTRTGAGTAGALSLIGGQWFWPLMGAWTLRYGGKVITNPVNMRAYRNAIDSNLPESVRAVNLIRLMRNMPEEWESFDQDLAELEGAQKKLSKSGANAAMIDAWGSRALNLGERIVNTASKVGESILEGDTPYVPKFMEPTNLPFSYMKGDASAPAPVYADQADIADEAGGAYGTTGSSITQNPNMSPNTAGWLYQGNTDAALASKYGGQKDGGMIEPLNAPRKMDKRGIISLVS